MLILVLSGVVLRVINVQGLRQKSRDSQRVADLKKIQTALELYFADNRTYPLSAAGNTWINAGATTNTLRTAIAPNYIATLPNDPQNNGSGNPNPCQNPTVHRYNYRSADRNTDTVIDGYILTAIMELGTSNDIPGATPVVNGYGCNTTNLPNWTGSDCGTFTTADVCYGVQNP